MPQFTETHLFSSFAPSLLPAQAFRKSINFWGQQHQFLRQSSQQGKVEAPLFLMRHMYIWVYKEFWVRAPSYDWPFHDFLSLLQKPKEIIGWLWIAFYFGVRAAKRKVWSNLYLSMHFDGMHNPMRIPISPTLSLPSAPETIWFPSWWLLLSILQVCSSLWPMLQCNRRLTASPPPSLLQNKQNALEDVNIANRYGIFFFFLSAGRIAT